MSPGSCGSVNLSLQLQGKYNRVSSHLLDAYTCYFHIIKDNIKINRVINFFLNVGQALVLSPRLSTNHRCSFHVGPP